MADNASITVRYAEATNGVGAFAQNGGQITVQGDAKGSDTGHTPPERQYGYS